MVQRRLLLVYRLLKPADGVCMHMQSALGQRLLCRCLEAITSASEVSSQLWTPKDREARANSGSASSSEFNVDAGDT